jgi:hypothetical protein
VVVVALPPLRRGYVWAGLEFRLSSAGIMFIAQFRSPCYFICIYLLFAPSLMVLCLCCAAIAMLCYVILPQSPKKVGEDIQKATMEWKGIKVTVRLSVINRVVSTKPTATTTTATAAIRSVCV